MPLSEALPIIGWGVVNIKYLPDLPNGWLKIFATAEQTLRDPVLHIIIVATLQMFISGTP
jgi:hypothetical protein